MDSINSFDFRGVVGAVRLRSVHDLGHGSQAGTDDYIAGSAIHPVVLRQEALAEPPQVSMTKVEAIIQTAKLEAVRDALHELGVEGMTVLEVRGHGQLKGRMEFYRGREYTVELIPKIKLEIILADSLVEKAVHAVVTAARTGKIGDGKIFLSKIDDAIRIRNDEPGEVAL